jgi:hypothetical protein
MNASRRTLSGTLTRMARVLAVALAAFALAGSALAAGNPPKLHGSLAPPSPRLQAAAVKRIFLLHPKVADWLRHYPRGRQTDANFTKATKLWTVKVWAGPAGEVATGKVDDTSGAVTEAWTGPQVAWKMARGYDGAFGGREINSYGVWLGFCALFLLGLGDLRRPFSLRNLDLLALLSFSVSLWFFNRGDIFTSVPLVYPPLVYLLGRMVWSAWRGRLGTGAVPVWPVWLLAAATVFAAGFRIGLNVRASNVIDVGYSGVIGADRIAHGQVPYGHFPVEIGKACGPADADGEIRNHVQTNGRCESANPQGDTYGPVAYEAYLPGYLALGWTGKWDDLPAAHFASIAFDLLCLLGLALVGLRFGGTRLAVTLAFAWVAYPFTQYVSSSNTNDALPPLFLIWGFWLARRPRRVHRALGLVEVRAAAARAALGLVSRTSPAPDARLRRRVPRGDGGGLLDPGAGRPPARRRARVLEAHDLLAARPPLAFLHLGLAPVPRGPARPAHPPARARGRAARRRGRRLLRPAPEVAAPARRPDRRVAARLRTRADALVLPLPAVVLPVRGLRRARAGGRAVARPRPSAG